MNKKLGFFIIGLIVALATEFFRFVITKTHTMPNWIFVIIAYIIILGVAYLMSKYIKSNLIYYISFGIFGMVLELSGGMLSEILNVGILGWIMWFSFWGSLGLIPRLYYKKEFTKKSLITIYTLLTFFIIFYMLTKNAGAAGLFFASLNIPFIIWHLRKKK